MRILYAFRRCNDPDGSNKQCDGTAKGGALIGINERLRIPIKFIGVGEKVTDLKDFIPDQFAAQIFD